MFRPSPPRSASVNVTPWRRLGSSASGGRRCCRIRSSAQFHRARSTTIVTVYSKPSCVQCTASYRELDKHGIEYEVIDLSTNPDALEEIKTLGHLQAPVVVTPTENWSGFRPDLIGALAAGTLVAA